METMYKIDHRSEFLGKQRINVNRKHEISMLKRIADILFSICGLIVLSPLLIIVAVLIKLESSGPVVYTQERLGLGGKVFNVIKLRSMRNDAEKHGIQWANENDSRVTRVGCFIRKTRIDELPQLVNMLKGDMTLIGPRPERPEFTAMFEREIPGFVERLSITPGVTGWAQINGGYDIDAKDKLMLDMYYIENRSLKLDINILFRTVKIVLTGEGAR